MKKLGGNRSGDHTPPAVFAEGMNGLKSYSPSEKPTFGACFPLQFPLSKFFHKFTHNARYAGRDVELRIFLFFSGVNLPAMPIRLRRIAGGFRVFSHLSTYQPTFIN